MEKARAQVCLRGGRAAPLPSTCGGGPGRKAGTHAEHGADSFAPFGLRAAARPAGTLQVARLIGADPKEIIFTSGATESNNLALKGVAQFYRDKKKHVITTQTEHKCVLDSGR